ncbi:hypothetical protein ACFOYU_04890 [Microvirga sp. GCM10011540]|uniref:hypothetical protein n=1 Tax=Microvirga sp. GCM10011540 TaxID=3317338 RepID=UPI0036149EDD
MQTEQTQRMLRVMPREMRMMTERIFSLTGLPKAFFLAMQDIVMYSQKLGLGGFALLDERFEQLKQADPARIEILSEQNSRLELDAGGQHAWFVAYSLVDLLGELAQRLDTVHIIVRNVLDPDELQVAVPLAARCGLRASLTADEEPLLVASLHPLFGELRRDEPLLWELLQSGAQIDAELWWRIYHLAQKALTPDSVVSRRHAGPLIVNDDGSVIGRRDNDDETDISFLTSPKIGRVEEEGAPS